MPFIDIIHCGQFSPLLWGFSQKPLQPNFSVEHGKHLFQQLLHCLPTTQPPVEHWQGLNIGVIFPLSVFFMLSMSISHFIYMLPSFTYGDYHTFQ